MTDTNSDELIVNYRGIEIPFSGRFKDAVFGRDVIKYYFNENFTGSIQEWLDPDNEFNSNNYGYRGPDLGPNLDLLTAGCSVTYGIGVSEESSWPAILAKNTGMSYAKIAKPGASVEWIVDQLFRYFHEFGHPKHVAIMFPDMLRGEVVINSAVNICRDVEMDDFLNQGLDSDGRKGLISHSTIHPDLSQKPRLGKKPFAIEDTTPPEASIYRAIRSIFMLEMYCKAAGINLVWSSWAGDLAELMRFISSEYKSESYIYFKELSGWVTHFREIPVTDEDPEGIMDRKLDHHEGAFEKYGCPCDTGDRSACICYVDCHQDYLEKYPDSFYLGTDRRVRGNGNAHMGVHKHVHAALDFENELKRRGF